MATSKPIKQVVQAASAPAASAGGGGSTWQPTPEARAQANQKRLLAAILWALAIGAECFGIFYVLKRVPFTNTWLAVLIGVIVVAGVLAVVANQFWKGANRLDPASEKDKVRFFLQNQLGAIITLIAFVPLIILILLDKNMSGKQKGIAGAVAIIVALVATTSGIDFHPVSQESLDTGMQQIVAIKGVDQVFWVPGGSVYHLCADVSDLQFTNKDAAKNQIVQGTVAQAVGAGKKRLTEKVTQEIGQCQAAWANPSAAPQKAVGADNADKWVDVTKTATAPATTTAPAATPTTSPT